MKHHTSKNPDGYLTKQIITYMGNKRKVLPYLESVFLDILNELDVLKKDKTLKQNRSVRIGDGFSGSGVVSRLAKLYSTELYVNDIAGYSETMNMAYLANLDKTQQETLSLYIEYANKFADLKTPVVPKYIQKYWSPVSIEDIKEDERVYFTPNNARRIDRFRYYIEHFVDDEYKAFLLAQLLVQSSIHNNTSGHFAAYYKKGEVGHFGGKNENDLRRIMGRIVLEFPVFHNTTTHVYISKKDTNQWARELADETGMDVDMDIMYYDPPYNKHPYSIYYFLLDIIQEWNIDTDIPNTLRGQPKNWIKSDYNSSRNAVIKFKDLIENTRSKFIVVSYNNEGIISQMEMERILRKKGKVEKIEFQHKTYNRMRGIAQYKKENTNVDKEKGKDNENGDTENKKLKEFIWVVDCRL